MATRCEYAWQLCTVPKADKWPSGKRIEPHTIMPDSLAVLAELEDAVSVGPGASDGWRLHSVTPVAAGIGTHAGGGMAGYGWGHGYSPTVYLLLAWEREVQG